MTSARDIISQVASVEGVPSLIPLSIADVESGWRMHASTLDSNGKYSYGLFQLNTAGLGAGLTKSQMFNPTTNSEIAIKAMKPWYTKGYAQGLRGTNLVEYVANNSGWPGQLGVAQTQKVEPSYDQKLTKDFNQLAPQYKQQAQSLSTPPPASGIAKVGTALGSVQPSTIAPSVSAWLSGVKWTSVMVVIAGTALAIVLIYRIITK